MTAAAEQRGQHPLRIKLAHVGEEEGQEDIALCYDSDSKTQKSGVLHSSSPAALPLSSLLLAPRCGRRLLSPGSGRSVLAFCCPGLTSTSHPTVVSVSFFSPSLLVLLIRYSVQRRSSELRHLHEQQRMLGQLLHAAVPGSTCSSCRGRRQSSTSA